MKKEPTVTMPISHYNVIESKIAELEKERDYFKMSSAVNYGLYCELLFSPNEPPKSLKAHNLEIRKQTVSEVLRYMEHSDVFIKQSDVDELMTELDVYLKDKSK